MSAAEPLAPVEPELSKDAFQTYHLIRGAGGLSPVERAVLKDMAILIGAEGSRWATHAGIAHDAGFCRSSVQQALASLERRQLLLVHRPKRTTLRRPPNHYALNLTALRALPPLSPTAEPEERDPDAPAWVRARRTQKPAAPAIARQPGFAWPGSRASHGPAAGQDKTLCQNPAPKPGEENARERAPLVPSLSSEPSEHVEESQPGPPVEPPVVAPVEVPEVSRAVEPIQPEAPTAPVPAPTHPCAERFLEAFRRQWAAAHGGLSPRPHRDDAQHAHTLADVAAQTAAAHLAHVPAAQRDEAAATAELLAHWTALYLAKPGGVSAKHPAGFLSSVGHGLRWFVDDLPSLAAQVPPAWASATEQHQRGLQAAREAEVRAAREAADAKRREQKAEWARRQGRQPERAWPRLGAAGSGTAVAAGSASVAARGVDSRPVGPGVRAVDERAAYERVFAFLPADLRAEGLALLSIARAERTEAQRQRFARLQGLALQVEAEREQEARAATG